MSQKDEVLKHLLTGSKLTPREALNKFGTMRLSAIIYDLKLEGYNIRTDLNKDGKPYAIYQLMAKVDLFERSAM